eukprot:193420_1
MMKLLLTIVGLFVAVLYAQTKCQCELGIYLKDVNGKCSGELKHIDTPDFAETCIQIFGDLDDSIQITNCKASGVNATFFRDQACSKVLMKEFFPAGSCTPVNIENHSVAIGTKCGENQFPFM